jgi:hypothetical protein
MGERKAGPVVKECIVNLEVGSQGVMKEESPVKLCVGTVAKSIVSVTDCLLEPTAGNARTGKGSKVWRSERERMIERIILLLV